MKDTIEEISEIFNLMLPLDQQLPTGSQFLAQFVQNNQIINSDILKEKFKGRVSYLKAMKNDINIKYVGSYIGNLKYYKVSSDKMSEFQTEAYIKAYKNSSTDKTSAAYADAREASLFVYPNGTYGKEGFKNYITEPTRKIGKNTTQKTTYNLSPLLKTSLTKGDNTPKNIIKNIKKYSSKYALTIESILDSVKNKRLVFVYNNFVLGSGGILFSKLLELFGFKEVSEKIQTTGLHYILLNGLTQTSSQISNIIDRFNNIDNMYGEYISVIIGSGVIEQGFSLKNIQDIHILTPWFNDSRTSQAIARGIRAGSHNDLLLNNIIPEVKIYLSVSLPNNNEVPSIDLQMYEISQEKDYKIKSIERLLAEAAVDCGLNYKRNFESNGIDGSRECNYQKCNYKCDGIDSLIVPEKDIDYSTYNIYYNGKLINEIIEYLKEYFKTNFYIEFEKLKNNFNYDVFSLITALNEIINKNYTFHNKYGFPCYLKNDSDVYFLVTDISDPGFLFSIYYTEYPTIKNITNFEKVYNDFIYQIRSLEILEKISSKEGNISFLLNKLPLSISRSLLKQSLIAQKNNITKNANIRKQILKHFSKEYVTLENGIIVLDNECLTENGWEECNEDMIKQLSLLKETMIENIADIASKISNNYYGVVTKDNKFKINEVVDEIKSSCNIFTKESLFKTFIKLKLTIPKNFNKNKSDDDLLDLIKDEDRFLFTRNVKPKEGLYVLSIINPMFDNKGNLKAEYCVISDKRKKKTGIVCGTGDMNKVNILKIILSIRKLPYEQIESDKDIIDSIILKNKYGKEILTTMQLNIKEKQQLAYWMNIKTDKLCESLKNWFEVNNLLINEIDDKSKKINNKKIVLNYILIEKLKLPVEGPFDSNDPLDNPDLIEIPLNTYSSEDLNRVKYWSQLINKIKL